MFYVKRIGELQKQWQWCLGIEEKSSSAFERIQRKAHQAFDGYGGKLCWDYILMQGVVKVDLGIFFLKRRLNIRETRYSVTCIFAGIQDLGSGEKLTGEKLPARPSDMDQSASPNP